MFNGCLNDFQVRLKAALIFASQAFFLFNAGSPAEPYFDVSAFLEQAVPDPVSE
jgi:hypothetical protein